ncbi:hypothetical protein K461DRAFT_11829 [Myriangium duriaei CBS 260.36]|uniref:Uncharacterized protein n=1 Tax=Myriangium duriaei CBS 260.36 TaxID=1168546 RepID=A0A9P4J894_9PEZI|nr:hypothetical protein K461DRAFT_11829 [Myriangium duriaei CBS 260.36]
MNFAVTLDRLRHHSDGIQRLWLKFASKFLVLVVPEPPAASLPNLAGTHWLIMITRRSFIVSFASLNPIDRTPPLDVAQRMQCLSNSCHSHLAMFRSSMPAVSTSLALFDRDSYSACSLIRYASAGLRIGRSDTSTRAPSPHPLRCPRSQLTSHLQSIKPAFLTVPYPAPRHRRHYLLYARLPIYYSFSFICTRRSSPLRVRRCNLLSSAPQHTHARSHQALDPASRYSINFTLNIHKHRQAATAPLAGSATVHLISYQNCRDP